MYIIVVQSGYSGSLKPRPHGYEVDLINYNLLAAEKFLCLTLCNNKQMIMLMCMLLCRTATFSVDICLSIHQKVFKIAKDTRQNHTLKLTNAKYVAYFRIMSVNIHRKFTLFT